MSSHLLDVVYLPETAEHDPCITAIADEAFGPGRFVRAAERVREMAAHDRNLSFVALLDGVVVGSVEMPGPVDQPRILGLPLVPGALDGIAGKVGPRR